ncbi:TetR/AcrR family transcriptional regulator [Bacillota bacterium Meth-B3]|nr:TetR/AcrR family transcriptional regulator [Christensenellaceae bacterium]MEA5070193.1 TetR/AcrR family transcriptional regulator [Christensenellaceae bacterium]
MDMRERIKEVAVEHFDRHGYHGTSIRNIAKDVNCSLPMIYYYFNNKKELFDEIIKNEFFDLLKRQAALLKAGDIIEFYTKFVYGLNALSDYDKRVYRLGIKVYLCFDGDEELREVMDQWERTILPRHHEILKPHLMDADDGIALTRTLVHLLENLIQSIVVKNRFLPEDEIREALSIVLHGCI